jgi:hypothetical protein
MKNACRFNGFPESGFRWPASGVVASANWIPWIPQRIQRAKNVIPQAFDNESLFPDHQAGGFRLASPVKMPVASETPRCAPPHTFGAGEEPEEGGAKRANFLTIEADYGTAGLESRQRPQRQT